MAGGVFFRTFGEITKKYDLCLDILIALKT